MSTLACSWLLAAAVGKVLCDRPVQGPPPSETREGTGRRAKRSGDIELSKFRNTKLSFFQIWNVTGEKRAGERVERLEHFGSEESEDEGECWEGG